MFEGDTLVVEHAVETDRQQAESLLPLVDKVLRETDTRVEDLAAIGLSIGPGSFTSLRIGVATVKGLAFGSSLPVVGVSTLQALAEASACTGDTEAPIVAMLNAQRGEVYAAGFDGSQGSFAPREDVLPELVYNADELAAQLPPGCRAVGAGTVVVSERLRELRGDDVRCVENTGQEPCAASIGRLAVASLAAGGGGPVATLMPRYVRRAEAEVTRTRERFEPPVGA